LSALNRFIKPLTERVIAGKLSGDSSGVLRFRHDKRELLPF
jgi:hypothetical protein